MVSEIKVSYEPAIKVKDRMRIHDSQGIYDYVKTIIDNTNLYETMLMLILDRANAIKGWVKLSQGGMSGTVVDPKIVFSIALKAAASAIVLIHNHPSGNLKPSETDIKITEQIKEGGKILDIGVWDHIIIGEDNYYSFADEGKM